MAGDMENFVATLDELSGASPEELAFLHPLSVGYKLCHIIISSLCDRGLEGLTIFHEYRAIRFSMSSAGMVISAVFLLC